MRQNLEGFGVIKYIDNETQEVTRKVFNCNTNVNIGAQLLLKKLNIQMNGSTSLPQEVVDNKDTYSVAAFAVGSDNTQTDTTDTALHKMYVIRKYDDTLDDPDASAQFLAGTYDIDHDYIDESGNTIRLVTTDNIDDTSNKANDPNYKNNYYWKKIAQVDYVAPNAVKYTLNLSDADVQDLTIADVADTNLTISEFGLYICMWDDTNKQIVDNTDTVNYAKILLARLTDSYIKTQRSSIVIEWTIGII